MLLLVDTLHKYDPRLLRIVKQKKMAKLAIIKAKVQAETETASDYRSHSSFLR